MDERIRERRSRHRDADPELLSRRDDQQGSRERPDRDEQHEKLRAEDAIPQEEHSGRERGQGHRVGMRAHARTDDDPSCEESVAGARRCDSAR